MPARDLLAGWRAARAAAAPEVEPPAPPPEAPPPPAPADPARLLAEALAADRPASDPAAGCAHCGLPETREAPLAPLGLHPRQAWVHWYCIPGWFRARRDRVADDLAAGLLRGAVPVAAGLRLSRRRAHDCHAAAGAWRRFLAPP
jgi:hypothetical protein